MSDADIISDLKVAITSKALMSTRTSASTIDALIKDLEEHKGTELELTPFELERRIFWILKRFYDPYDDITDPYESWYMNYVKNP